jgi:hypothetical protein
MLLTLGLDSQVVISENKIKIYLIWTI